MACRSPCFVPPGSSKATICSATFRCCKM
jgi:hypothetical protein